MSPTIFGIITFYIYGYPRSGPLSYTYALTYAQAVGILEAVELA